MSAAAEAVALPRVRASAALALPVPVRRGDPLPLPPVARHATPTVFNDELLYSKLSQSLAAGARAFDPGRALLLSAPLAPLVQAPAWLLSSMTEAYAAAKLLNAA
jgi:hypothetical protein